MWKYELTIENIGWNPSQVNVTFKFGGIVYGSIFRAATNISLVNGIQHD